MALQIGYPEIGKKIDGGLPGGCQIFGFSGHSGYGCRRADQFFRGNGQQSGDRYRNEPGFVPPQSEKGMTAYEMMLSESQERMLLVAEAGGREAEIIELFTDFGLEAAVIGRVIEEQKLRLLHLGEVKADVPIAALVDDAPVYDREAKSRLISARGRVTYRE